MKIHKFILLFGLLFWGSALISNICIAQENKEEGGILRGDMGGFDYNAGAEEYQEVPSSPSNSSFEIITPEQQTNTDTGWEKINTKKKKAKKVKKPKKAKKQKVKKTKKVKTDRLTQKNRRNKSKSRKKKNKKADFQPNGNDSNPTIISVDLDGVYQVDIDKTVEVKEKKVSFKDSEDIKYLYGAALKKVNIKDFENALILLDKCIDKRPNNKEYLQLRANVYTELSKFKKAIKDYEKAIQSDPEDHLLHYNLAATLLKVNKLKEAIKSYTTAVDLKPDYVNALQGRATAKTMLHDYESAIYDYNLVLDQQALFVPALKGRGIAKGTLGRGDEAVIDFTSIIKQQPMDGVAYFYRAVAYEHINQIYKSCADFDKAYQLGIPQAKDKIQTLCR